MNTDRTDTHRADTDRTDTAGTGRRTCGGPAVNATRLIIVGIDGSDNADAALRWAMHIGRTAQALIHLIAVCPDRPDAETEAHLWVDTAIARVLAATPASMIDGRVHHGHPAAVLVNASTHATMLVLGSHGRSGPPHPPVGSVATECTRTAHCPVVIVPGPDRLGAGEPAALRGVPDRRSIVSTGA